MTSKPVSRLWQDAEEKRGPCIVCGGGPVHLSHVTHRRYDEKVNGNRKKLYVHPASVVSLCSGLETQGHHDMYDSHELNLLPYLSDEEIQKAIEQMGNERALRRMKGPDYKW